MGNEQKNPGNKNSKTKNTTLDISWCGDIGTTTFRHDLWDFDSFDYFFCILEIFNYPFAKFEWFKTQNTNN